MSVMAMKEWLHTHHISRTGIPQTDAVKCHTQDMPFWEMVLTFFRENNQHIVSLTNRPDFQICFWIWCRSYFTTINKSDTQMEIYFFHTFRIFSMSFDFMRKDILKEKNVDKLFKRVFKRADMQQRINL